MMAELKTRVDELKMENEYQLRLKDMSYNEKIKELTEKFIQEMESLKTKNQVLKTEKDKEEAKHDEEMGELMEKNAKELQDLGTSQCARYSAVIRCMHGGLMLTLGAYIQETLPGIANCLMTLQRDDKSFYPDVCTVRVV